MTLGRTLWAIILIKLFIMFAILKVFFFPDLLAGKSPRSPSLLARLGAPPAAEDNSGQDGEDGHNPAQTEPGDLHSR